MEKKKKRKAAVKKSNGNSLLEFGKMLDEQLAHKNEMREYFHEIVTQVDESFGDIDEVTKIATMYNRMGQIYRANWIMPHTTKKDIDSYIEELRSIKNELMRIETILTRHNERWGK